jgi:hypothetical protein
MLNHRRIQKTTLDAKTMKMDVKIELEFSKKQQDLIFAMVKAVVEGEVTRQLKFKRNEDVVK